MQLKSKCLTTLALLFSLLAAGSESNSLLAQTKAVKATNGMVVSVSAPGSEAGLAMLKQGGNAVDAAVATAFALAVTYPAAGNIGGGGFMIVHPPGVKPVVVEYRETAPAAATPTMFAKKFVRYGHRLVGVPGTVRGLELAHKKFGKLTWKTVVAPAIELARNGFILDKHVAKSLNDTMKKAQPFPEFARVFGKKGGGKWQAGNRLVQPDLAKTLQRISEHGAGVFYDGVIADQIVAEMKSGGGIITKKDLTGYRANIRPPVHGVYKGCDVYGPSPPSSGGICLVEMLNILDNFPLQKWGRWSPKTLHVMVETMRRAYYDRARYLGDSDFVEIPRQLLSREYAQKVAREINTDRATPSETIAKEIKLAPVGDSTTHFSVIDKDGMAVSNTYTLEHSYGSLVVVKGAGFLLNNEMHDFNRIPGHTDRKGNIGTKANLIAPQKRMLSSQTPVIIAKNGKAVLITGSPGGRTIINTSLCMVVNVIGFDMNLAAAVAAPRIHHQWFPDLVKFEGAKTKADVTEKLRAMGHRVIYSRQGDAHSIQIDPKTKTFIGVADPRLSGYVAAY